MLQDPETIFVNFVVHQLMKCKVTAIAQLVLDHWPPQETKKMKHTMMLWCQKMRSQTCTLLPRSEEGSCPKDGVGGEAQKAPSLVNPA